jgi:putative addiction module CopG family antidote
MPKHIQPDALPEDLARFAEAQVAAGHFPNVEDVFRAAKNALERQQRNDAGKMDHLRAAIAEEYASPDFEGNAFDNVRAEHRLPRRPAERKSLAQLFAESPLKGLDLKFERDKDVGRPVAL